MVKKKSKKARGLKKGSKLVCGICGVAVTVDTACGCLGVCDIVCCGKQMKPKR